MSTEKVLCKVFGVLDIGIPNMSEFDNRLKYQKIIYLLQSFTGLSLGYGFKWYLKGPYSSPLAHSLYFIEGNPTIYEESQDIAFKQNDEVISKLTDFRKKLGDCIDHPLYLEVLASLHYIDMANFDGGGSQTELKNKLLDVKPNLESETNIDAIIEKAYKDLRNY